jgi:tRNA-modifying protein YgfZ
MMTLPSFVEIVVAGPDARTYLHGQFATDVNAIEPGHWRHGCYCVSDGRVQALMMIARDQDQRLRLLLPADIAEAVTTRLLRYRIRARCTIDSREVSVTRFAPMAATPSGRYSCAAFDWQVLPGSGQTLAADQWAQQLALGVPWIGAPSSERFLPQMLALERLQAFSLRKGCYPGQEVIARTHFLGRSKRRLVHLRSLDGGADVPAGTELVDDQNPQLVLGLILATGVNCASTNLAVVIESATSGMLARVDFPSESARFVIDRDVIETKGDDLLNGVYQAPSDA